MKTSNKLLIVLAVLLIIVPIIAIAINMKMNYVYAAHEDYISRQEINNEPFDQKSKGRFSIPLQAPFSSVNILDAESTSISLHLKQAATAGIKIPDYAKDAITVEVKDGVLNIVLKNRIQINHPLDLVVYSPVLNKVTANNLWLLELSAASDSLQINLNHVNDFSFGGAITTNNNKGEIVKTINQTDVGYLTLNLNNSNFNSSGHSYQNLVINTKGQSAFEIGGDEQLKDKFNIKNLVINTTDTATVKIGNVKIDQLSGKISDNTSLQVPVVNLKQLFKN